MIDIERLNGADTILIPFEIVVPQRVPLFNGMTRMRPRGALYRGGVVVVAAETDGEIVAGPVRYRSVAPVPIFAPLVFVPGSRENEAFVRSTEAGLRALGDWAGTILEARRADRPPPGSKPIDETPWSGDHGRITESMGLGGLGEVKIDPDGNAWAQNPDGTWTNEGPAGAFTGSGEASGRKGKHRRDENRGRSRTTVTH